MLESRGADEVSMGVAFFDLDRTLLANNSARAWIMREVRLGHLSRREAVRAAFWLGLYGIGFARMEATIRRAVASLEGGLEAPIRQRSREFWAEEVLPQIRPGARAVVERHRRQGDRLVLLTSSSNYLSELACETFGLDEFCCNVLEVSDGVFTGTVREPLCFGSGKATYIRDVAGRYGVPLERCTFYTDSYSDLPALEVVGMPVVVHPDPRLEREARRCGWPVELWGTPSSDAA